MIVATTCNSRAVRMILRGFALLAGKMSGIGRHWGVVLVHVLFRTLRSVSVETANLVLALESPDRRDAALPKTTKREGSCRCSIQRQCALFYVLWFGWNTGKDNKKEMGETSIIAIRKFVCVCEC